MSSGGPPKPPPSSPPPGGWPPPGPGQPPPPPPSQPQPPAPTGPPSSAADVAHGHTDGPRPTQQGPAPIVPDGDQQLAPRVLTLWRAGGVIPFAILLVFTLVPALVVGGWAWVGPPATVALGVLVAGLLPGLRYRRWRWRMTERALELEHGVVFRQVRALPYFRIQHIDVEHGPLDRWLGLARLEVHTASVTATLPGLPAGDAPGIRAALLSFAGSAVAAEPGDDAV